MPEASSYWRSEAPLNSTSIEDKFESSLEVELGGASERRDPACVLPWDMEGPPVGFLARAGQFR